jgi:hypothetical protein
VLEKGITNNNDLFNWFFKTTRADNERERKSGSVVLMDQSGMEVKRWNFFKAFPCRWVGPELVAGLRGEYAIERIEIAHTGLEVDNDKDVRIEPRYQEKKAGTLKVSEHLNLPGFRRAQPRTPFEPLNKILAIIDPQSNNAQLDEMQWKRDNAMARENTEEKAVSNNKPKHGDPLKGESSPTTILRIPLD